MMVVAFLFGIYSTVLNLIVQDMVNRIREFVHIHDVNAICNVVMKLKDCPWHRHVDSADVVTFFLVVFPFKDPRFGPKMISALRMSAPVTVQLIKEIPYTIYI